MLEFEINIKSVICVECDVILFDELSKQFLVMLGDVKVMFKLLLLVQLGFYDVLVDYLCVLCVVVFLGGYNCFEVCVEFVKNCGIIVSFSCVLLEDLCYQMSDDEFVVLFGQVIDVIYQGLIQKVVVVVV